MSKRMEELLKSYPEMVQKRDCLAYQIAHFRGLSVEEVIQSMYTPRQDGERVQSSTVSDKTAQIALTYQERRERMNREWYEHLEAQLKELSDDLSFLEAAIHSLTGVQADIMWDMVVEQMKWDAIERKYRISHTTLYRQRRKAISRLENLYAQQEHEFASFVLG